MGHFGTYGTAFGYIGDVMACLGEAKHLAPGSSLVGIVADAAVARFVQAQRGYEESRFHVCTLPGEYHDLTLEMYDRSRFSLCGRHQLARRFGIPAGYVEPTHLHWFSETGKVWRWQDAKLPVESEEWAIPYVSPLFSAKTFLLHPYSTDNTPEGVHWANWDTALDWLLKETPHRYVLTGRYPLIRDLHPRLINLAGVTPSVLEVLALTRLCSGVITTSNNLSLWSYIDRHPTLVCCNALEDEAGGTKPSARWIDHEYNRLVRYGDGMEAFRGGVKWLTT